MKLENKKARFEYELTGEGVEAGLVLKGCEAKSIREGRADISQSFVKIIGNEAYLVNANVPAGDIENYDPTHTRKLLLHRKEILSLVSKSKQKKLQIVPLRLYNKGRIIKLYCELGKSKRQYEKKEAIKKHDIERDIEEEFRGKI